MKTERLERGMVIVNDDRYRLPEQGETKKVGEWQRLAQAGRKMVSLVTGIDAAESMVAFKEVAATGDRTTKAGPFKQTKTRNRRRKIKLRKAL